MRKNSSLLTYGSLLYVTIGAYWVTLSWTILGMTGNQGAVGRLLIIASVCTLLAAPTLGLFVDRMGIRKIVLLGQAVSLFASMLPILISVFGYTLSPLHIYIISLLVAVSSILCLSSFDKILKFMVKPDFLRKTRMQITIVQQIALMVGTAISGFLISKYSVLFIFYLISIITLLNSLIFLRTVDGSDFKISSINFKPVNHWLSFVKGIQHITQDRSLLVASICVATAYASAQVINVSLPAYIQLELGNSSNLFGICESFWALGGIISAITLTALLNKFKLNWFSLVSLGGLGVCMTYFATLNNPVLIICLCLVMGVLFSASRTLADASILTTCEHDMIGRVRSNIMAFTSMIGIIIYLIPIICNHLLPSSLYVVVGLGTVVVSLFLLKLYIGKGVQVAPASTS